MPHTELCALKVVLHTRGSKWHQRPKVHNNRLISCPTHMLHSNPRLAGIITKIRHSPAQDITGSGIRVGGILSLSSGQGSWPSRATPEIFTFPPNDDTYLVRWLCSRRRTAIQRKSGMRAGDAVWEKSAESTQVTSTNSRVQIEIFLRNGLNRKRGYLEPRNIKARCWVQQPRFVEPPFRDSRGSLPGSLGPRTAVVRRRTRRGDTEL